MNCISIKDQYKNIEVELNCLEYLSYVQKGRDHAQSRSEKKKREEQGNAKGETRF